MSARGGRAQWARLFIIQFVCHFSMASTQWRQQSQSPKSAYFSPWPLQNLYQAGSCARCPSRPVQFHLASLCRPRTPSSGPMSLHGNECRRRKPFSAPFAFGMANAEEERGGPAAKQEPTTQHQARPASETMCASNCQLSCL